MRFAPASRVSAFVSSRMSGGVGRSAAIAGSVIAVLTTLSAQAAPPEQLKIAVTSQEITITGATPNVGLPLLGVGRETRSNGTHNTITFDFVMRSDAAGAVHLKLDAIPPFSVWCAIDPVSGNVGVATPPAEQPKRTTLPAGALRAVGRPGLNQLRFRRSAVEVLWVRRNVGAWLATVYDGGSTDADGGFNGYVTVVPSVMQRLVGSPPPPSEYLPRDLFVVIDKDSLEVISGEAAP